MRTILGLKTVNLIIASVISVGAIGAMTAIIIENNKKSSSIEALNLIEDGTVEEAGTIQEDLDSKGSLDDTKESGQESDDQSTTAKLEPTVAEEPAPAQPAPAPAPVSQPQPTAQPTQTTPQVESDWLPPTVTFEPASGPAAPVAPEPTWQDITGLVSTDDYHQRYAGVCPNDQPRDSIFWDMQRFLAFARHYDHKWPTPIYYVDVYWSWYMIDGGRTGHEGIANFASLGFENHYANSMIGLWIDYDTLTIYWDKMIAESSFTPIKALEGWDEAAEQATDYLRHLDAAYKAKCNS